MKLIAFMIAAGALNPLSPPTFFGDDYSGAFSRMEKDRKEIAAVAQKNKVSERLLCAMVFPEYIRYSYLSGLIETASLELLYVNMGPSAADFSIGEFQVKPSCLEVLEENLGVSDKSLEDKYNVLRSLVGSEQVNRKNRLKQLSTLKGQALVACAFIETCIKKYGLENLSEDEQLQYIATAYNKGLQYEKQQIETSWNNRYFPHGKKYRGQQFAYWEVAMDYYMKYREHEEI